MGLKKKNGILVHQNKKQLGRFLDCLESVPNSECFRKNFRFCNYQVPRRNWGGISVELNYLAQWGSRLRATMEGAPLRTYNARMFY